MADPREGEEILLNMIRGSAEEGRYDDRERDENPEGIDDGSQYLVTRMTKTMLARSVIYAASYVYIHEIQKNSFINCLVSAYISLYLNDNHGDQQKSTRPEEADGGPIGYHGFR
jgi:hypothetical protein